MKAQGIVKKIAKKEWNGKTLYNLGLDQDGSGNLTWYGFGVKNPGCREETAVEFEASQNQKGYWVGDADTIEIQKQNAPAPAASGNKPAQSGGGFADRQASITLQTAFKVATEQANGMLAGGVFKPATNTKAAKENAMESYLELVKKLAAEMHVFFMNPDDFEDQVIANQSPEDGSDEDEGEPFNDDIPFG